MPEDKQEQVARSSDKNERAAWTTPTIIRLGSEETRGKIADTVVELADSVGPS